MANTLSFCYFIGVNSRPQQELTLWDLLKKDRPRATSVVKKKPPIVEQRDRQDLGWMNRRKRTTG